MNFSEIMKNQYVIIGFVAALALVFSLLVTDFGGRPGPFLRLVSVFATMRCSLISSSIPTAQFISGHTAFCHWFCKKPSASDA